MRMQELKEFTLFLVKNIVPSIYDGKKRAERTVMFAVMFLQHNIQ